MSAEPPKPWPSRNIVLSRQARGTRPPPSFTRRDWHLAPAKGTAPSPTAPSRTAPSQVVGQRLRDMPVEPELRFAPRRAWPRIPGHAARGGAAYPGLPLRCCFFHRQMRRGAAVAAVVGGCHRHESTPPQRAWLGVLVLLPSRQGSNGCPATTGKYCWSGLLGRIGWLTESDSHRVVDPWRGGRTQHGVRRDCDRQETSAALTLRSKTAGSGRLLGAGPLTRDTGRAQRT